MNNANDGSLKLATQSSADRNDTLHIWITTADNPFDPFTDFDNWYRYDESNGYCTSGYLARYFDTDTSDMGDEEYEALLTAAIEIILKNDFMGQYFKVTHENGVTKPRIHSNK
jgi:hypothetical protein